MTFPSLQEFAERVKLPPKMVTKLYELGMQLVLKIDVLEAECARLSVRAEAAEAKIEEELSAVDGDDNLW